jgi:cytochrome c oxidase subunit IV
MATAAHTTAAHTKGAHKHPNYMAIFWWLAVLTAIEIGVIYLPIGKLAIGVLLCALAVGKAALVAMYFMHLRFETRTLGLIAITPLAIATLLVFVLLPDGFAVMKRTEGAKATTAGAPAKP